MRLVQTLRFDQLDVRVLTLVEQVEEGQFCRLEERVVRGGLSADMGSGEDSLEARSLEGLRVSERVHVVFICLEPFRREPRIVLFGSHDQVGRVGVPYLDSDEALLVCKCAQVDMDSGEVIVFQPHALRGKRHLVKQLLEIFSGH